MKLTLSRSVHILALVLVSITSASAQGTSTPSTHPDREVRVVYLVPSDRTYRGAYENAIGGAIQQLQTWYHDQMGNRETFSLSKAPKKLVEVFTTSHPASWYSVNPAAGLDQALWFFYNALADGFQLAGGQFNDPQNRWVLYIDADPGCGQATGALEGVALLPANDLRGLVGEDNVPVCAGQPADTSGTCRWVGGLGHELGHTFGLPHPVPCPGGSADGALMCLGYISYPDAYLSPDDKSTLNQSPFFDPMNVRKRPTKGLECELQ